MSNRPSHALLKRAVFIAGLGALALAPGGAQNAAHPDRGPRFLRRVSPAAVPVEIDMTATPALRRRVSLASPGATLGQWLATINRQTGLKFIYSAAVVPVDRVMGLRADSITVAAALTELLVDAGVDVVFYSPSVAGLVERSDRGRRVGTISGRVTDGKTGRGIPGATVSLATGARGVPTSEDGTYRLTNVAGGAQTVQVRMLGYAKQSRSVTMGDGATLTVDFALEASASVLDQVIVTGTVVTTERKAVPNAMTVVTAKELEERGITSIDQLFRGDIPGVFVKNHPGGVGENPFGTAMMYVRGVSTLGGNADNYAVTTPFKTYVDGVELANSSFLTTIDPKSIERIEFISGPQASTIYGSSAINGVMQVFTKKRARGNKGELSLTVQSGFVENSMSSALTPQHDVASVFSSGAEDMSYSVGAGYAYLGHWYPGAFSRTRSAFGSLRRVESRLTAEASARLSRHQYGSAGAQLFYQAAAIGNHMPSPGALLVSETNPAVDSRTLGLVVSATGVNWWQHRLSLGTDEVVTQRLQGPRTYSSPGDTLRTVFQKPERKLTAAYNTTLSGGLGSALRGTLTTGADYMSYESNQFSVSAVTTVGSLTGGTPSIARGEETNLGYFAQGQLGVKDALFLTAGIRLEDNSSFGRDYGLNASPRFGASFVRELGPVTAKLRAAYGRSTRPPGVDQREGRLSTSASYGTYNSILPNQLIGPEQQTGPEAGIELYLLDRVSLQLTSYRQTVEHLIVNLEVDSVPPLPGVATTTYAGVFQYQNAATVRNRGLEATADVKVLAPFSLGGTWSYTRSRVEKLDDWYQCSAVTTGSIGTCLFAGQSLMNLAEHTASARARYTDARSTAILSVSYIGQRLFGQNHRGISNGRARLAVIWPTLRTSRVQIAAPGHWDVDINATRALGRRTSLILGVTNAGNRFKGDRDDEKYWPVMGRSSRLGVKIMTP